MVKPPTRPPLPVREGQTEGRLRGVGDDSPRPVKDRTSLVSKDYTCLRADILRGEGVGPVNAGKTTISIFKSTGIAPLTKQPLIHRLAGPKSKTRRSCDKSPRTFCPCASTETRRSAFFQGSARSVFRPRQGIGRPDDGIDPIHDLRRVLGTAARRHPAFLNAPPCWLLVHRMRMPAVTTATSHPPRSSCKAHDCRSR